MRTAVGFDLWALRGVLTLAAMFAAGVAVAQTNTSTDTATLRKAARTRYMDDRRGYNDPSVGTLFQQATDAGDPLAVIWLARMYKLGYGGLAKDEERAAKLVLSVLQPFAISNLGASAAIAMTSCEDKIKVEMFISIGPSFCSLREQFDFIVLWCMRLVALHSDYEALEVTG